MRFGSIAYLNLLPFWIFVKRLRLPHATKFHFAYKRGVPSKINRDFVARRIDAAFISSAVSRKARCTDAGIVAKDKVYSVLLLPEANSDDPASASSNLLAQILGLQGRVLIGDTALVHYLQGGEAIDLAEAWRQKTGLPFVFARLCYHRHGNTIKKIAKRFTRTPQRIPQYILEKESRKRGIAPKQLRWYLMHIHYEIDHKAKRGLRQFLREAEGPASITLAHYH